jgi:hypothetical protein
MSFLTPPDFARVPMEKCRGRPFAGMPELIFCEANGSFRRCPRHVPDVPPPVRGAWHS